MNKFNIIWFLLRNLKKSFRHAIVNSLQHINESSHSAIIFHKFLTKYSINMALWALYSPNLVLCDFSFFHCWNCLFIVAVLRLLIQQKKIWFEPWRNFVKVTLKYVLRIGKNIYLYPVVHFSPRRLLQKQYSK